MQQVMEYNITDAAIATMEHEYMVLSITDLESKEQFEAVHAARMVVKGKRVEVEKKRKELKADAVAWGKLVDGEAKRIFGLIEPIESHLKAEEDKVHQERERIKAEEERIEHERLQGMLDTLMQYGKVISYVDAAMLSEDEYQALLSTAKAEAEAVTQRKAEEEAARKAEENRLEKIRLEQEAERKRLEEQEEKSRQEREALEAEKRAIEEEKRRIAQEEAERKAAAEAEAREKAEAEEREKREAEETARKEALKPDIEKLHAYVDKIAGFHDDLNPGTLSDDAARDAMKDINDLIWEALDKAKDVVLELA